MRRLQHHRHDGFTLVECVLTCALVAVVLAAAFPVVPLFFSEANTVQNTYGSLDQLVLASETVTRYVHEAVDPSPTATTYPFASASGNAVTFYADTGLSTGPEEVVVSVTSSGDTRILPLAVKKRYLTLFSLFSSALINCAGVRPVSALPAG